MTNIFFSVINYFMLYHLEEFEITRRDIYIYIYYKIQNGYRMVFVASNSRLVSFDEKR